MKTSQSWLGTVLFVVFLQSSSLASAASVSFAGFAYAGDHSSVDARFPHVRKIEDALATAHQPIDKQLSDRLAGVTPAAYELRPAGSLASLKGSDQAIAMALVLTNETVSTERLGEVTKLLIVLNAQVMYFDFKTQTVLRAYPVDAVYIDALNEAPSDDYVIARTREMLLADGAGSLMSSFVSTVKNAVLPSTVSRYLQIVKVSIDPDAAKQLPASLMAAPGVAETWLADKLDAAFLGQAGVPMLPYSKDKGYAIGKKMAMRFADGDVYTLTLPEADYAITVELQSFKKVKFGDVPAGTSFIYGAFVHVQLTEPLSGHSYLDASFKDGETKVVPARQSSIDDAPAFQDALDALFKKLAATLGGSDDKWIRSATSATDIGDQIRNTRKVLNSCK